MPYYYIRKNAHLRVMPSLPVDGDRLQRYVIGDLHGNFLKLIYALVSIGAITNLTTKKYNRLYKSYTNSPLSLLDIMPSMSIYNKHSADLFKICSKEIRDVIAIINSLEFHPSIEICILGDDLNDRGLCDYYTLLVYDAMFNAGVKYEVILSNHSVEFVYNYEQKVAFDAERLLKHDRSVGDFYRSSRITQALIQHGIINRGEVGKLVSQAYLPRLKLMTYHQENDVISFYTHAPVGISLIKQMLSSVSKLPLDSIAEIKIAIDDVNQRMHTGDLSISTLWESSVLAEFLWNTNSIAYDDRDTYLAASDLKVFYVHGHDDRPMEHITLDGAFGKSDESDAGILLLLAYNKLNQLLAFDDGCWEYVTIDPAHNYVLPSRYYLAVLDDASNDSTAPKVVGDDAWALLDLDVLRGLADGLAEACDSQVVLNDEPSLPISAATSSSPSRFHFFSPASCIDPLLSYLKQYLVSEEALQCIKSINAICVELSRVVTDQSLIDEVLAGRLFGNKDYFQGLLIACESAKEEGSEACQRAAEQLLIHGKYLSAQSK